MKTKMTRNMFITLTAALVAGSIGQVALSAPASQAGEARLREVVTSGGLTASAAPRRRRTRVRRRHRRRVLVPPHSKNQASCTQCWVRSATSR